MSLGGTMLSHMLGEAWLIEDEVALERDLWHTEKGPFPVFFCGPEG